MEYDFEEQRLNAFIICNNKLYESRLHYYCYLKAIEEITGEEFNKNITKYNNMTEPELEKIIGNVVTGDVAIIDNNKCIIYYNKNDLETIKNYYNISVMYNIEDLELAV